MARWAGQREVMAILAISESYHTLGNTPTGLLTFQQRRVIWTRVGSCMLVEASNLSSHQPSLSSEAGCITSKRAHTTLTPRYVSTSPAYLRVQPAISLVIRSCPPTAITSPPNASILLRCISMLAYVPATQTSLSIRLKKAVCLLAMEASLPTLSLTPLILLGYLASGLSWAFPLGALSWP